MGASGVSKRKYGSDTWGQSAEQWGTGPRTETLQIDREEGLDVANESAGSLYANAAERQSKINEKWILSDQYESSSWAFNILILQISDGVTKYIKYCN